jgi:hypothetical protein
MLRDKSIRRSALLGALVFGLTLIAATAPAPAASESRADITIRAFPTITRFDELVIVSGALLSAKANESVTVQGKACGVPGAFFQGLSNATTNEGGGWEASLSLNTKTVLRAVSGSDVSRNLTVQVRAPISLAPMPCKPSGRFRIAVGGVVPLGGKRVTVERFDPASGRRRPVRTVVLDASGKKEGFRIAVPNGETVRAVLPQSQAKPCYLAGYSRLVRT